MHRLMTVVVLFMALTLIAPPATAQTAEAVEPPIAENEPARPSLTLPTIVWAAAAATDFGVSMRLQTMGIGEERNPLYRWTNDHGTVPMATVMLASNAVAVWAVHKWVAPKHPRLVKIGLYVAAAAHTYFAIDAARHWQRANQLRREANAPPPCRAIAPSARC